MPHFFLTMPHDTAESPTMESMDPAELEAALAAAGAFNDELAAAGALVHAAGLMPPSSAVTVDATDGSPRRLREPFVDAPAHVGGFWIIDAADEAAAVDWAEQAAVAFGARIEVRGVQEAPE